MYRISRRRPDGYERKRYEGVSNRQNLKIRHKLHDRTPPSGDRTALYGAKMVRMWVWIRLEGCRNGVF